jgi:lysophospholipase L1-like esterase
MNTNSRAHRILCYGDSNTWGRSGQNADRYSVDVRWTGLLQNLLGSNFEIIEEGLRSRTTNLDDSDPQFPGRNGLTYLRPCLESHSPLDVVILWLGTNDLKTKYNRNADNIAQALIPLIKTIQTVSVPNNFKTTKILLISPPIVKEEILKPKSQFEGAGTKSQELALYFKKVAGENCDGFINLAEHVHPGTYDGVHLEKEEHSKVAAVLAKEIRILCQ